MSFAVALLNGSDNTSIIDPLVAAQWRKTLAIIFAIVTAMGALSSLTVCLYIVVRKRYNNFVSNHFIAHLTFVNFLMCACLVPVYVRDLYNVDNNAYGINETGHHKDTITFGCRFHAFVTCTVWTVVYYMMSCIAGVHLITFARIHYEQLFGLSPSLMCGLAWLAGVALGLPCLTNRSIADYNSRFHSCVFNQGDVAYRFLAYILLLGVLLPIMLTIYAYVRVLCIFYHSPLIYKHLGLFKSRFVIFALILLQLTQVPFYLTFFLGIELVQIQNQHITNPLTFFIAYSISTVGSYLYGLTLFLMKEDDIALTHRAPGGPSGGTGAVTAAQHANMQRQHNSAYVAPGIEAPQLL